MSLSPFDLCSTSDPSLLEGLKILAARGEGLEADLLVHLGEVEVRGLAVHLGFQSLFAYCTEVLHFSESVAFHRITAARAARRHPQILERIRSGELHLSGLRLLLAHLTAENCGELLDLARHQSKRAIERRLADRAPKPDAPAQLRRLPERIAASKPLVLESQEAQALLRHQIPDGDLGRIFDRALAALLRDLRRVKFSTTEHPRAKLADVSDPASRHIPAAIRRAVAERDGERCTFVADDGRLCGTRDALEFHHVVPFARSHRHHVDEVTLRCRAHNASAAIQDFGAEHMASFRRACVSTATRPGASCEK